MVTNKYRYTIFVALFLISSCNNRKSEIKKVSSLTNFEINLPDSIEVNKDVFGEITYSSVFDTVVLKENERRYIFLYLAKTKKPIANFEEFKKVNMDTFVRLENKVIPIYDINFNTKGAVFLDGYIIDQIFLDSETDSKKVNISTFETKINHPIIVYDIK